MARLVLQLPRLPDTYDGRLIRDLVRQLEDAFAAIDNRYTHDHTGDTDGGVLTDDTHDGFVEIGTSAAPSTPAAGKMRIYAQDASGVARLRALHSTGSDLAFFRDSVVRVKNTSGVTINKGEVAYITGATGNLPTIAKAKANAASTMPCSGMVLATATNNSFTTLQFTGEMTGLDTSAFVEGARVYVSPTTAGALTATEPAHPNFSQQVGTVTKANAGDGRIQLFVSLQHEGDDYGSNRNAFSIGDAAAGAKTLLFVNTFVGTLSWEPTANRTLTLPDVTATLLSSVSPIVTSGNLEIRSAALLGYGTGAGGTVTQLTDKSTAVTLNKPCGKITMHNAALAAGASVFFTLNNTLLSANDGLVLTMDTTIGGLSYNYWCQVSAGAATIIVKNVSAGSLSDALNLNFQVIKGATS